MSFIVTISSLLRAGKFQMQVLPQCGHAVHEDIPDRVCGNSSIFTFFSGICNMFMSHTK